MRKKWEIPPAVRIVERNGQWYVGDTDHRAIDIAAALALGQSADQIKAVFRDLPEGSFRAVLRWIRDRE